MAKRYIDADTLIKSAENKRLVIDTAKTTVVEALQIQGKVIREAIENAPTADVVEVVRCKDCVYWQDNNDGYPHKECRWGKDETPDAYDFCSYGERRTDDE